MHLLVTMHPEDKIRTPEQLDDVVSAEIPSPADPELRELVKKLMIHKPYGDLNNKETCMDKKGNKPLKCRYNFPKSFSETSSFAKDEMVQNRRRYNEKLDRNSEHFNS